MNFYWLLPPSVGVFLLLATVWMFSENRWRVDWGLILRALSLQILLALLFTQVPQAQVLMLKIGQAIEQLQHFANTGASFVFGGLSSNPQALQTLFGQNGAFIFALKLLPVLVFVASLIAMAYHLGILQAVVQVVARLVNAVLGVSGAEALSNVASVFIGQVEAQLLVKPYLKSMTNSELLAIMAGSLACISGGMMAVYIGMGIPSAYLLTASIMAIPASFAVAKILIPETQEPLTQGNIKMQVEKKAVNLIDAAAQGASEGWHIGISVLAMLMAFISLVAFADAGLMLLGKQLVVWGVPAELWGISLEQLSLSVMLGKLFYFVALGLGVPSQDALTAGSLLGTKMVLNEFVAYSKLIPLIKSNTLEPVTQAILSVALCGFANLGSVAIQLGGIGAMVPERRSDIARLGLKAMCCGTVASYLSATLMGGLFYMNHLADVPVWSGLALGIASIMVMIGSYFIPRPSYHLKP
jgi:CNT family concentrative nucleoside transporter